MAGTEYNASNIAVDKTEFEKSEAEKDKYRLMAGAFALGISGVAAGIAGYVTSYIAKKKGREYFGEMDKYKKVPMESPVSLALRALAYATVLSVGVCSLTVYGVWKYFGFKDLDDFRTRVRKYTGRNKKPGEGRSDFENLRDLINYLQEESEKKSKKSAEAGIEV